MSVYSICVRFSSNFCIILDTEEVIGSNPIPPINFMP